MFIPDPDLDFLPIRISDPRVKKGTDLGSGSSTLNLTLVRKSCATILFIAMIAASD
jgi:hypothetical protein